MSAPISLAAKLTLINDTPQQATGNCKFKVISCEHVWGHENISVRVCPVEIFVASEKTYAMI
jgi:hypothetical protein